MKIAVLGAGISGLGSAYLLSKRHQVDLYEKDSRLGGHARTTLVEENGKKFGVDTGFLVFNHETYPFLTKLFEKLDVKIEKSDMSFGFWDKDENIAYNGNSIGGLFFQKKNLFNLSHYSMINDIMKFNKKANNDLETNSKDLDKDLEGEYDAIIAVEMFEAVGKEYFDIFFKKCEALLKPSGVLALQIIAMPDNRYESYSKGTDFIQKYIFPGGHLPSVSRILKSTSKHTRLNLLHMEEFTEDYAKTLNIWYENFNARIKEIKALGFDDYFIRMWKMYLNYCEAAFLTRNVNLVQVVFTRDQNMHLNKGLVA